MVLQIIHMHRHLCTLYAIMYPSFFLWSEERLGRLQRIWSLQKKSTLFFQIITLKEEWTGTPALGFYALKQSHTMPMGIPPNNYEKEIWEIVFYSQVRSRYTNKQLQLHSRTKFTVRSYLIASVLFSWWSSRSGYLLVFIIFCTHCFLHQLRTAALGIAKYCSKQIRCFGKSRIQY